MVNLLLAPAGPALSFLPVLAASPTHAVPDVPFAQESHDRFPIASESAGNDVRAVLVGPDETIWAATRAGIFCLPKGSREWRAAPSEIGSNPAFALARHGRQVLVGAWNGLFEGNTDGLRRVGSIHQPIVAVAVAPSASSAANEAGKVFAAGPDGLWRIAADGSVNDQALPCSRSIRAMKVRGDELLIATGMGLYRLTPGGGGYLWSIHDPVSADVRALAEGPGTEPMTNLWAGGLGGITVIRVTNIIDQLTPARGLPNAVVQCLARDERGTMWAGTPAGVERYDGQKWSVRRGPRWLLNDDVRDIDFQSDGTAWIATAGGVSALRRPTMTLADKAKRFHAICAARHVRPPGIVEKCRLRVPGDVTTWEPEDDDNDGGYTALYLAMQSFRCAVTRDPEAASDAKRAFDVLEFLQTVTQTPGFLARSVIPADWTHMHDANEQVSDAAWVAERVEDPRNKRVPVRWRKSADGKWLWKGDTSSDEITAHFFGYLFYHELAADAMERVRVRNQVCRIVDHIVGHGFLLVDEDGAPTRWGVWAPDRLNHDPDWAAEAGINSVEMLSYLKLAHHLSGEEKYRREYLHLLHEEGYLKNVLRAKTLNPAKRTHIDDELLAFAWPALLMFEPDPEVRAVYRQAFELWHDAVRKDHTPFFEVLYAALSGDRSNLETPIEFLRDQPLDLVRWTVDNSRREDLRLVRSPELEEIQTDRLLPPSERGVPRTDENPWRAVQGDDGRTESDGVFWLLPYWMGRYYEFIAAPK